MGFMLKKVALGWVFSSTWVYSAVLIPETVLHSLITLLSEDIRPRSVGRSGELLLALASTVILGSESRGTHGVVYCLTTLDINPVNPSGYYMYHLLEHTQTLHSAHTVYLCVPYGSHNKQRLFPQTALTGWAL
jgi:hypothetical protein